MTLNKLKASALVLALAAAAGCSSKSSAGSAGAPDDTLDDAGLPPTDAGHKDVVVLDAEGDGRLDCTLANEGCPCDDAGATAECKIYFQIGDYKACTIGEVTCTDAGTWGACFGNKLGNDAGK